MAKPENDPLELGWGQYCLAVKDINATWDFYRRLGFVLAGGDIGQKWAVLHNGDTELGLFQGMLPQNIINFRGGHIQQLAGNLRERGFKLERESEYDPAKYPREWATDAKGGELPLEGSGCFNITGPVGEVLFFDTVPVERAAFAQGKRFSFEAAGKEPEEGHEAIGDLTVCLPVEELESAAAFYSRLGMAAEQHDPGSGMSVHAVLVPRPFRVGLYTKDQISDVLLNFRGGNVFAMAERFNGQGIEAEAGPETEEDGSDGLWLRDPDGNRIYFNTSPEERQY